MRIVVLTSIYATTTGKDGTTPVVHYFAREWVRDGHEVRVYHLVARYLSVFYLLAKVLRNRLYSHLGFPVPTIIPRKDVYDAEGVLIKVLPVRKLVPHSRTPRRFMRWALETIKSDFRSEGAPDVITGHWDDPVIDLATSLKDELGIPICQVFHVNSFNLSNRFGADVTNLMAKYDLIGFRSLVAKRDYESRYGAVKNSFLASSGVSEDFILEGGKIEKTFDSDIKSFVFVGSMIARKHPATIVKSLQQAYPEGNYKITFIGDGLERDLITRDYLPYCRGEVIFAGRVPRGQVGSFLRGADFFVMISEHEVFGLVYLEAMAFGLIPIGSRNEGIDGIIVDGENGFLCRAGDADELTGIFRHLDSLSGEQLCRLSACAKKTAGEFSDRAVARRYAEALRNITMPSQTR